MATTWTQKSGMDSPTDTDNVTPASTPASDTDWTQKSGMGSATETDNIETLLDQAQASADAAAASATAAAASEVASDASETASAASEAAAAASETAAAASAATATTKAAEAASSATDAQTAQTAAEAAQTASEAAQTASEAAQAAAETAETNAAASASSASTDAAASAASASASASSASAASASETASAASAVAAAASEAAAASSASAAATSETNSAASAASASSDAASAASSAAAAATSASVAGLNATSAANSASSAATSASDAATSATNAAASYDDFDDRYLGAKASDPTLDNDGDALITGALYFNTTDGAMKVYDGSSWLDAYASLAGTLLIANNLSDLDNAATARTNLGLGTAATTASTDYATAAQGALADSALQSADIGVSVQGYSAVLAATTASYTTAEETKLAGIEALADVTDTANVTAAGALMDSEVTNLAAVKAFDPNDYVGQTATTGSAELPVGTTAERDGAPAAGYIRFNSTDSTFEGYDGTAWGSIGGGAGGGLFKGENGEVGSSAGDIFRINEQTLNTNVTIDADENASATGPLAIASGVTLTVTSGGNLSIV